MKENLLSPEVTDYIDPQHYLLDYYSFRKSHDPEFSYQKWCEELQFSDRSFLRMVVMGRRKISDATKNLFLEKLNFTNLQQLYFSYLVEIANATNTQIKADFSKRLIGLIQLKRDRPHISPDSDFLSHPKIPALHVLLGYEDVDRTVDGLAKSLKESTDNIRAWIGVLEKLDFVESDKVTATWRAKSKSFKVSDRPHEESIINFHQKSLSQAQRALMLPKTQRKFRSLFVAANEDQLNFLWEKYDHFAMQVMAELEGQPMSDRQLFQVNFNMVPTAIEDESSL